MDIEEDIKILENLKKYLNLLIYEGTHKIIYNDLGWDEKTIDCINAIDHILEEREEDKKKIAELEAKLEFYQWGDLDNLKFEEYMKEFIPKQKIKDLLTEIQEEYNEVQEQFDCIWNKKSKDDYDRYKLQEFSTMQQQLGFFIGKLEELLEEK